MRTWITADLHLGHTNAIKHSNRPYDDVREMDEALIANYNAMVGPRDTAWILGDYAYKCTFEHMEKCFKRMNGSKHLILGNHDDGKTKRLAWASVSDVKSITVDGVHLFLSHYAHRTWPRAHKGSLHLYGHSHGKLPGWRQSCDVGVDCWAQFPTQVEDIQRHLLTLPNALPAVSLDELGPEETDDETSGYVA